jgi:hypothetical protein
MGLELKEMVDMTGWMHFKYAHSLGVLAKLRKITTGFVMSVCLSVCLSVRPSVCMEQFGSYWTDFHEILYLSIFRKSVEKIQVSFESHKKNACFTRRPVYIYNLPCSLLLRMGNLSYKVCKDNQNTHFMVGMFFFSFENRTIYEIMWKAGKARQAAESNIIRRMRIACHHQVICLISRKLYNVWC